MPDLNNFFEAERQVSRLQSVPGISSHDIAETFARQETNRRADLGMADILHSRLMDQIKDFESKLDETKQIGAMLSSFGSAVTIRINHVGFQNPYFIVFYGVNIENANPVKLVQHTTQLSILFVAVDPEPEKPVRRLGFTKPGEE